MPERLDYQERLAAERDVFAEQVDVHGNLPESAHRWARRHLLPKLRELGVPSLDSLVVDTIRAAAEDSAREVVVLSLGSGNGDLELGWLRALAAHGVHNVRVRLLEINSAMQRRAADAAREHGLSGRVEHIEADFNTWCADAEHDVVVAYQVLHHVLDLEHLYGQVRDSLRPDGTFVVHDMIGRNGHRRWPEAHEVIDRIWATLPPELRRNAITGEVDEHFADIDCAADGFEGIRSQDVLPVLLDYLHPSVFLAAGNVVDPFVDRVYGHNFDMSDEHHRALIDDIGALDDTLVDLGVVTPTRLTALFHPRPATLRAYRNRTPERSVRRTDVVDSTGRVSFHPGTADPHGLVRGAGLAVGRLNGVHHDRWVGRTATVPLRTTAAVDRVEFDLYVPEWMPTVGTLAVALDGEPVGCLHAGHGATRHGLDLRVPARRTAELTLSAGWWAVPREVGVGADRRHLSYVLNGITLGAEQG
ncbi:SAM-dependent methyltransferase [Saccharomonospora saliphila]|uniref:SAM-dependent methyltransferase n=1 Tax=Saccharomonospora saliphila TaxID=369829 RepID=UPI00036DF948|nr:class I SAM-dependent methyltransferase [Saccharomonospora saliphila]